MRTLQNGETQIDGELATIIREVFIYLMGGRFQDYSWVQDFEVNFLFQELSRKTEYWPVHKIFRLLTYTMYGCR